MQVIVKQDLSLITVAPQKFTYPDSKMYPQRQWKNCYCSIL